MSNKTSVKYIKFGLIGMLKNSLFKLIFLFFLSTETFSSEHVVKGVGMEWKPSVTFAKTGDRIKFIGMIGHDSESIENMLPSGAQNWKSKMGEEGFTVTLDKEGLYIYKCNPHVAVGMFGAIVVGEPTRLPNNFDKVTENLTKVRIGKNAVKKVLTKVERAVKSKLAHSPS